MKRFFPFLGLILLILTACLPPIEERHEFIIEVVGNAYLDDVMDWYQPSYGDYLVQAHPVIVLYYPDESYAYYERATFYEQYNDFVAAAGVIVDTADLKNDLGRIWNSYYPIYDVDVWWQADREEWQARVKGLTRDVNITTFFVVTFNGRDNYCEVVDIKDEGEIYLDNNGVYHLGPLSGVDGFAAFVQENPRELTLESNTKILGAEVRWIK
ncbi:MULTISPECIES: hypothetical protein [unclassified Thermotoga]|uniref:hypothetical protein n=1 Tax=unclassified Thermotoga TaxID=2631113 RepID=UPI000280E997|nr:MULTISPECIES: hypothetical protein [unclassified Thermotoga]AIY85639.1 hypothetical protein T2812B_00440 [Thermotoga sp. 2812B]EJX26551.1 hypothetical protein EMP_02359 [Thermotoga sp. EMP]